MRRYLLRHIARLTVGAPILVLSACALLTAIALVRIAWSFRIETNILALLPDTAREMVAFHAALKPDRSFDYLLAVVESREPNQEELLVRVAALFAEVARGSRCVQAVEYAPGSEELERQVPELEERFLPALLTNAELSQLDSALQPPGLEARFERLRFHLARPISPARRRQLLGDPLGLREIVRPDRIQAQGPVRGPIRDGLLISQTEGIDGRAIDPFPMLLMVLRPRRPATDLLFTEELMRSLRAAARYAIEASGPAASGCRIEFIGSHAEAENDAAILRRDLKLTLIASFVLVVLLFILAVRRIEAVLFVGLPLAAGLIWTLALATLLFERISAVTCAFGAVLVGLGIDYAIHLCNRYLEEREGQRAIAPALEIALCETGQGVVVAALTTAVGFLGMYFTHIEALQELGIVGTIGILFCLAAMLLILPALLVLSERTPRPFGLDRAPSSLGLGRLAATVQTYPRLTLTLGLIVTVYLGFFAERIRFDEDVRRLRQSPPHYDDLVRRVTTRFDLPDSQIIAMVSGRTLATALARNDALYDVLEQACHRFPILGFDSLRPLLPAEVTQRRSQERLRAILTPFEAIEDRVRLIAKKQDFQTTVALRMLDPLRRWKAASTDESLVRFDEQSSPAFAEVVRRHAYGRPGFRVVTNIYPRRGEWNDEIAGEFVSFLRDNVKIGAEALEITGLPFVAKALKGVLVRGIARAVILVMLAVFLLLILHFRSIRKACVAAVPVVCSTIWTLGTMQQLGMPLNFLNIIVIPLILGLGIDHGIHILQRYYEGGRRDLAGAVEKTGRAIVVTSLTAIIAFGTLSFATFRGVREIGIVAIIGVAFTLIASMLFVPALLRLAGERLRLIDLVGPEKDDHLSTY